MIIDPLMAFLGGEVDSHKDSDIRRVLARVKKIAEQTQAAILVVRHLNKMISVGEAMYRGGGSISIIGAAKSALMVAKHPTTPCLRVLARIKGNLSEEPPALGYALDNTGGGVGVAWLGELDMTALRFLPSLAAHHRRPSSRRLLSFASESTQDAGLLAGGLAIDAVGRSQ